VQKLHTIGCYKSSVGAALAYDTVYVMRQQSKWQLPCARGRNLLACVGKDGSMASMTEALRSIQRQTRKRGADHVQQVATRFRMVCSLVPQVRLSGGTGS
jgi:hypothetical protein